MNFQNKTVWITGASSGIGKQLAIDLAEKGAKLIISARNENALNSLVKVLPGSCHRVIPFDLENHESLQNIVNQVVSDVGHIDILINNGGISQRGLFEETDFSVYKKLIDINYLSYVIMIQAVLPSMIKQRSGHIVSISSIAGKVGSKLRSGYSGSKFAVVGLMDCIRAEVDQYDIKCLTVFPGFVNTNIAINALTKNGDAQSVNDKAIEQGYPVEKCSEEILSAISKNKSEIIIGKGSSVLAPKIKKFFPRVYEKIIAKKEYR